MEGAGGCTTMLCLAWALIVNMSIYACNLNLYKKLPGMFTQEQIVALTLIGRANIAVVPTNKVYVVGVTRLFLSHKDGLHSVEVVTLHDQ